MTSDDRLDALLDRLADHVLTHGLAASSLRALARAAGTSDRMLLYYFPDKNALMVAVLGRVAARMTQMLGDAAPPAPLPYAALRRRLATILAEPEAWPFMRLWLEMAGRGAQGDATLAEVGEAIGRAFLAWGAAHLDCADSDRPGQAARLLVEIEGGVLLRALGMGDIVARALGMGDIVTRALD